MGLVLITFATVGAKTLFTESIKHVKTQFTNWKNEECKIKCLCKHSYSILWFNDNEVYLKCCKCNKTKKIRLDDSSFKTFLEVWRTENKKHEQCKNIYS